MQTLNVITLSAMAAMWLVGCRVSYRWSATWGVTERASRLAFAIAIPACGLIASTHVVALISLVVGRGLVTPITVAIAYAAWTVGCVRLAPTGEPGAALVESLSPSERGSIHRWRWAISIVATMYVVFLIDALTRYPQGYDAMYYHFPVAIQWMRDHALTMVPGINFLSNPENGMIVPFLLSFVRAEVLFPLVHVPHVLLTGAAVFGLIRAVGVGTSGALAGAVLALGMPVVAFQGFSGYIDLYGASFWLTSLLALTWASRVDTDRARRALFVVAGLSAGVALGSKTTHLVLVTFLAAVAFLVEWTRAHESLPGTRRPMNNLLLFSSAVLVCSAFWFVRGTVEMGNPFYPLGVRFGDVTLLPGTFADEIFPMRPLADRLARWWYYPWRETKIAGVGYAYSVNGGMGAAFAAFVPVGLLVLICSRGTWRPRTREQRWRLVLLMLSLSGAVLILTVFQEMVRFVLPLLILSVVPASVLIDRLSRRSPRLVTTMITVGLSVGVAVGVYKPARACLTRAKNGLSDRHAFYGVPRVIDETPVGTRILNLADASMNYGLMGRDFRNYVIDPNVWRKALCVEGISSEALRRNRVDYVYASIEGSLDWPADLPVRLVPDDSLPEWHAQVATGLLYRVESSEEGIVARDRSAVQRTASAAPRLP